MYPKMYAAILEKVFLLPVFENFSEIAEKRTLFKIILDYKMNAAIHEKDFPYVVSI